MDKLVYCCFYNNVRDDSTKGMFVQIIKMEVDACYGKFF